MKKAFIVLILAIITFQVSAQSLKQSFVFLENKGQFDERIKFSTQQDGVKMYLGKKSIHYVWNSYENLPTTGLKENPGEYTESLKQIMQETYRLDVELIGANSNPKIQKVNPSSDVVNYYKSFNGAITNVHQYSKVIYKNIYNGIDWVWYNINGKVKYDFVVHPGADYKQIKIKVSGADEIFINPKGGLTIKTPLGEVNEAPPVSFINNEKITSKFIITGTEVSFEVEDYPKTKKLIIDPTVLWSTYYGGNEIEVAGEVVTTDKNEIYVVGSTYSDNNIFFNGYQQKKSGPPSSGFIVKFDNSGKRLWATYFGGYGIAQTENTFAIAAAVDENGNLYVTGETNVDDSIVKNAHQSVKADGKDAFLAKFSPLGILKWATYYGGNDNETGIDLKIKGNGILLGGNTRSSNGIAKTSLAAFRIKKGGQDAFLANFDTLGTLRYGYYIGGPGNEYLKEIAHVNGGGVILAGVTTSTGFFAKSAFQSSYGGGVRDVFMSYINLTSDLAWQTYYGGSEADYCGGIVLDNNNNIYLLGYTSSTNNITSTGAHKTTMSGSSDAFIAKFDILGNRIWGTYYGGESDEVASNINLTQKNGDIVFTGRTKSLTEIDSNGLQPKAGSDYDLYIGVVDKTGKRKWGTYFGDTSENFQYSLHVGDNDVLYLLGITNSSNFFGKNGHQNANGGGTYDAFLSVIAYEDLLPVSQNNVGPFCGQINYQLVASKPFKQFEIRWYNEESDTIPFFVGDTLNSVLTKSDTLWIALHSSTYNGPKKPIITTIIPVPNIKFSVSDTIVCQINNKIICINEDIDTTADYTWNFGDGFLSSLPVDTHTYLNAGTYIIALQGKYNNSSCIGTKSRIVRILISPTNQKITGPLSSGQGKSETYSAKFVTNSKYLWTVQGGNLVGNDSSASVIVKWDTTTTLGKVGVSEVNNLGCKSFEVIVDVFLDPITKSIQEINKNWVKVFPNPAENAFFIKTDADIKYYLYDITGREVLQGMTEHFKENKVLIDQIDRGIYYLHLLYKNKQVSVRKMLIE